MCPPKHIASALSQLGTNSVGLGTVLRNSGHSAQDHSFLKQKKSTDGTRDMFQRTLWGIDGTLMVSQCEVTFMVLRGQRYAINGACTPFMVH